MKLYEFEGKKLFVKYSIPVPRGTIVHGARHIVPFPPPYVVKAQTLFGERKKGGGVLFAKTQKEVKVRAARLLEGVIRGTPVRRVLVEERVPAVSEYYISIGYDTDYRGPVLLLSPRGGSGISRAVLTPVDMMLGMPEFFVRTAFIRSNFPAEDVRGIVPIVQKLWDLFLGEHALLAEINPLLKTRDGRFIAGDAKVILDDEKIKPGERRFLDLGGDIAVLASGGGASLLNIDALLRHGGKPANYTEYSGNPPSYVVKDLTKKVFAQKGLKGCWVVGGTANFTDIYETMRGFVDGLREVKPQPTFPIVVRRDGPRQKEAFAMLREVAAREEYRFHLFGAETPMTESARVMVKLAYGK